MNEHDVERKCVAICRGLGLKLLKLRTPGWSGAPDRVLLLPGARTVFFEMKCTGGKPRENQISFHLWLRDLGFPVYVIDDPEDFRSVVEILLAQPL